MYRSVFIVPSIAKRGGRELHEIAPQNIIFAVNFSLPSFGRFPLLCQTPLFPPPISIYVSSEKNTPPSFSFLYCLHHSTLLVFCRSVRSGTISGLLNLRPMYFNKRSIVEDETSFPRELISSLRMSLTFAFEFLRRKHRTNRLSPESSFLVGLGF